MLLDHGFVLVGLSERFQNGMIKAIEYQREKKKSP